jgi:hypothetical protein
MNAKYILAFLLCLLIPRAYSQNIVSGEYFFDTAPEQGSATSFSLTAGTDVDHQLTIPTTGLAPGFHNLFIRVKNDLNIWSLYEGRMLYILDPVTNPGSAEIVGGEWFIDTDPGIGNGTSITLTAGTQVTGSFSIPNTLTAGIHNLFIRVKNDLGKWSLYEGRMFYIFEPQSLVTPDLVSGEWFINTDPGIGNGTAFTFSPAASIQTTLNVPTTSLNPGINNLFIRVKNNLGKWSNYEGRTFYVLEKEITESNQIVKGEWFVDTDPGVGSGTEFTVTVGTEVTSIIDINSTGIATGQHYLFLRVLNSNGVWSLYEGRKFLVCSDVLPNPSITGEATICENTDLNLNATTVPEATSYYWRGPDGFTAATQSITRTNVTKSMEGVYSVVAARGTTACDTSIASTVYVLINQPTTNTLNETACVSYSLNGQIYTASGEYTQTLTNAAGCDSTITLNLTINQPTTSTLNETACSSYLLNGQTYSASGEYTQTIPNAAGCDSTITLNLIIKQPTSSSLNKTACVSYTLNTQTYTSSGIYTQVLTNAAGCDSTITLNLTINAGLPSSSSITETACSSYTLNSQTYTTGGIYTQIIPNATGCDSTITLNLTIKQPTTSSLNESACSSYTLNNQTFSTSGVYTQTLQNAAGCDSTLTLTLTIKQPTANTLNETACNSFTLNSQTYNSSGTYKQTFTNAAGCDSILTLNLIIKQPTESTLTEIACKSYTINNQTYSVSGVYTQTLINEAGCDSTITLNLTVKNVNTTITLDENTLTAEATGAAYQWIDCNNSDAIIPGETNRTFKASEVGDYAVIVTYDGCRDTSNCITVTTIGISDLINENDLKIYPNPASTYIIVKISSRFLGTAYYISDLSGRNVLTGKLISEISSINVAEFSAGLYFFRVGKTNPLTFKVMKK